MSTDKDKIFSKEILKAMLNTPPMPKEEEK